MAAQSLLAKTRLAIALRSQALKKKSSKSTVPLLPLEAIVKLKDGRASERCHRLPVMYVCVKERRGLTPLLRMAVIHQ